MSDSHLPVFDQDGFRLRGTAMARIDAFSDVVFGFALTLLVVSLEVPKTYAELHEMLMGFVPFAICFWFLIVVWVDHYEFFRRFGLHNPATIRLNSLLLFVILFYVYPLKFLFRMLAGVALGNLHGPVFSNWNQLRELMILYGVGFALVYALFALLNHQGWRQRKALGLTPREELLTRSYILEAAVVSAVGLLSCAVAVLLPPQDAGYAGWTYVLIAIYKPTQGILMRRKLCKLDARDAALELSEAEEKDHVVVDAQEV